MEHILTLCWITCQVQGFTRRIEVVTQECGQENFDTGEEQDGGQQFRESS